MLEAKNLFHRKSESISVGCLSAGLQGLWVWEPLKELSSIHSVLCLSWTQSLLTFKTRCFDVLSGRSLKAWLLNVKFKYFDPQGEGGVWCPLLATLKYFPSHSPDMQEVLSTLFTLCSSKDVVPFVAQIQWKEVSSGSFYTVILNQNFHSYVKQVKIWVLLKILQEQSTVGLHKIC